MRARRDCAAEHVRRALITPAERASRRRERVARSAGLAAAGKIAWSESNEKLRKLGTLSFGIPAGVADDGFNTCPAKGACAGWCYARQGFYVWPHVADALERNLTIVRAGYDRFVAIAIADLRERRPKTVRVHDSGDFFEVEYLRAWFTVAATLPKIVFYAYTKMHWRFATMFANGMPRNFRVVQSFGGQDDERIDLAKPHARVFVSHEDREVAGYVDGTVTDAPAIAGVVKIGLVYHSGGRHLTLSQERALRVFPILSNEEPQPVSDSLPILFDCAPRAARMLKSRCAEDWYLANGGAIKKLDALSSLAKCAKCPVGQQHRQEIADGVASAPLPPMKAAQAHATNDAEAAARRERIRAENRRVLDVASKSVSPEPAPRPSTAPRSTKGERVIGKCSSCGNKNKRLPADGVCRKCRRGEGVEPAAPAPVAKAARSAKKAAPARGESLGTLVTYLELLDQIDVFESAHPGVIEGAQVLLKRITSRGAR